MAAVWQGPPTLLSELRRAERVAAFSVSPGLLSCRGVDGAEDLQALVARRGALKTRMLELRASSPDDHDGFLRTVDQLMAVSDRIVDLVSSPEEILHPEQAVHPEASLER